jgi:hypothetical protein
MVNKHLEQYDMGRMAPRLDYPQQSHQSHPRIKLAINKYNDSRQKLKSMPFMMNVTSFSWLIRITSLMMS